MNKMNLSSVDTLRTFGKLGKRIYLVYRIDADNTVEVDVPKMAFLKRLEEFAPSTPIKAVFNELDRSICLGTMSLVS